MARGRQRAADAAVAIAGGEDRAITYAAGVRSVSPVPPRCAPLELRGRVLDNVHPGVMAIVNRTPDSFYDANRFHDLDAALAAMDDALSQGADIIDVGGARAEPHHAHPDVALVGGNVEPLQSAEGQHQS